MMQLPTMQKIRKKHLLALAGILALLLFLRLTVFGPAKVEVAHLAKRDLVAQVYGNGTVEAKVVVNIASKITGRLVEVGADQGDLVKRGQVLAKLDLSELQAQNRQAEASLALATKNAARFKALAAKDLVSRQEAEQYETAYLLARLARESDRVTEELEVDVAFTPARKNFRLGEQAEVLIATGARQGASALPKGALATRGKQRGVWVVANNRLSFQEVVTGLEDMQGMIEITRGLTENEAIALAAPEKMQKFSNGQKVRVGK